MSYPLRVVTKNNDGFALILEVGLTKNSMDQVICKTLKKQYIFITEFTLSAPRAEKPVSVRLDIYL